MCLIYRLAKPGIPRLAHLFLSTDLNLRDYHRLLRNEVSDDALEYYQDIFGPLSLTRRAPIIHRLRRKISRELDTVFVVYDLVACTCALLLASSRLGDWRDHGW